MSPPSALPLLAVERVEFAYPQAAAAVVRDVSLTLHAGDSVAIVGSSGSGKSTLLHVCAGLERPARGRVAWDDRDLDALHEPERTRVRRRFTGVVFQDFHLLAGMTAAENVALALALARPDWPAARRRDAVRFWIERLGLSRRADAFPEQLSGGEQQRVALARALAHEPRLVLADEPTGNLDSDNGEQVFAALIANVHHAGAALLMVTHNQRLAERLDRCWTMRDGRLIDPTDRPNGSAHASSARPSPNPEGTPEVSDGSGGSRAADASGSAGPAPSLPVDAAPGANPGAMRDALRDSADGSDPDSERSC